MGFFSRCSDTDQTINYIFKRIFYTGWFTDSGYFEMLITPSIFELSLQNKKCLSAYYWPFYGIVLKNPQN